MSFVSTKYKGRLSNFFFWFWVVVVVLVDNFGKSNGVDAAVSSTNVIVDDGFPIDDDVNSDQSCSCSCNEKQHVGANETSFLTQQQTQKQPQLQQLQQLQQQQQLQQLQIPQADPDITGYPVSRYVMDRRMIDVVDTVRPEHVNTNPLGVSAVEWKARTELAAAYRALYVLGLERSSLGSDQAAQCLMMRLPKTEQKDKGDSNNDNNDVDDEEITFLMADWGVWFEEVTASNLLKFTSTGILIHPDQRHEMGQPNVANIGCIPVAKAIFEARPDVNMIVHIHPYAVMAVSGTKHGLLPLSQAAFFLWGQVSREEYDFSYESDFESTLQQGFENGERAMLLNHHGMYAVGRDVAEGLFVATHLTQACEVQVQTLSMVGGDLSKVLLPDGKELSMQYRDMMDSTDYSYDGSREWPGIVRKVQRQAPNYNQ